MIKDPQLIPKIPISLMNTYFASSSICWQFNFQGNRRMCRRVETSKRNIPLDKDVQIKSIDIDGLEAHGFASRHRTSWHYFYYYGGDMHLVLLKCIKNLYPV